MSLEGNSLAVDPCPFGIVRLPHRHAAEGLHPLLPEDVTFNFPLLNTVRSLDV